MKWIIEVALAFLLTAAVLWAAGVWLNKLCDKYDHRAEVVRQEFSEVWK